MNAKRAILVAVLPLTAACSWLTDFRQQPSVGPWQSTSVSWADTSTPSRGAPQGSVPTVGTAVASYQISYGKTLATIDSFSTIPNPIPPTQESVDRGWKYFQTNCAACHGKTGMGDGPAAAALKVGPANLTELAKKNGGKYPAMRVTSVLSGQANLAAHGNTEMPVWGSVFRKMSGGHEAEVQQRIANLNHYVESLQAK